METAQTAGGVTQDTETQKLIQLAETYGAHNYHPLPVVITTAKGVWVKDPEGKKYLDCLSSYSALNQGHRHPAVIKALTQQAKKATLTSRAFHNDQIGWFFKELCEISGYEAVLPMNSGAEAVETALKTARKWGYKVKGIQPDKAEIIVCANNFHGRTIAIVGFSTEAQYKDGFGPFTEGFKIIEYGNADALKNAVTPNTAAFLVEPIQGEAGIIVPPAGYLKQAQEICRQNNILFMADEIQTGLGRTGKMFCCGHEEVKPDIMILGKALGGGVMPVSAVLSSRKIMDVFHPGDHGSTFGGNPLACAVARASLKVLVDEKLAENASAMGTYFMQKLSEIKSGHVKEIRGRGLLIGVELKPEAGGARRFCEALMGKGLLCKETHANVIRFAPPLVITRKEIDWAVKRIAKVLKMK